MSTAAVVLNIEIAFDTTWHCGLLYKLSEFSTSLVKLITSFLTDRKLEVKVAGEFTTPVELAIAIGVPQGSVLAPVFYSPYMNDAPAATGTYFALLAADTCIYATEKHERRVLCKLQRGLTELNSWCESWNVKVHEGKSQKIYFSRRLKSP
jgi:hypothetical protein